MLGACRCIPLVSPPATCTMLPVEIIEECLDNLVDKASLAVCARAHSSFAYICQRRLFSDITICTSSDEGLKLLLLALELSPHLGTYVHRANFIGDPQASDLATTHLLPSILDRLTALRSLSGRAGVFKPATQTALANVLRQPTLESLCLDMSVDFPFHLIRAPSLKHLTLIDASESGGTPLLMSTSGQLRLRTLRLQATKRVVLRRAGSWIMSEQLDLSGLRALMLDPDCLRPEDSQKLLRTAAQSLQVLAVLPHTVNEQGPEHILSIIANLPFALPSLHTLVLHTTKASSGFAPGFIPYSFDFNPSKFLDIRLTDRKDTFPALREVVLIPYKSSDGLEKAADDDAWWKFDDADKDVRERLVTLKHRVFKASMPRCAVAGIRRDALTRKWDF